MYKKNYIKPKVWTPKQIPSAINYYPPELIEKIILSFPKTIEGYRQILDFCKTNKNANLVCNNYMWYLLYNDIIEYGKPDKYDENKQYQKYYKNLFDPNLIWYTDRSHIREQILKTIKKLEQDNKKHDAVILSKNINKLLDEIMSVYAQDTRFYDELNSQKRIILRNDEIFISPVDNILVNNKLLVEGSLYRLGLNINTNQHYLIDYGIADFYTSVPLYEKLISPNDQDGLINHVINKYDRFDEENNPYKTLDDEKINLKRYLFNTPFFGIIPGAYVNAYFYMDNILMNNNEYQISDMLESIDIIEELNSEEGNGILQGK